MAELKENVDILEPEEKEFSLSGGSFFEEHPEKLLAEPYEASGRFGPVTKYRAKGGKKALDVLSEIETPAFIAHGITDLSAGQSVIKTPDAAPTVDEDINLRQSIETTKQNIVKRQKSEKRQLQEFEEPEAKPTIPFEDVLRTYNKNLSDDEIKAFLWYMHQRGNTYRGKWLSVFNPTILSQEQESAYINKWVKEGILFYDNSELLPGAIYFGEDLYARKVHLEEDKADIERIYGAEALATQQAKLGEAFEAIYNNRLKLDDPDAEKRLHLKPYGDFTGSIMIKNWNLDNETGEPEPFVVIKDSAGNLAWYSKRTDLHSYRDPKAIELSITDAFRWWLKFDDKRPDIGHNFNWEDIFKYYLDKKAIRKIDDPTVIARNRAIAKEVGDRLFSQFLSDIILENDRVKIETIWNEKYNSSTGVRTEKIPIAFECALYYPENEPIEIKAEKREAVAFASLTGSSLNAYQVGVGKTWAAILSIANFLDSEQCERPVIIVPNQVYKQFYAEIRGILPHRKVNDLYNLGSDYYDKLLDEDGKIQAVEAGSISMLTYEGFEQIGFNEQTAFDLLMQLQDALTQIQEIDITTKKGEKDIVRIMEKLKGMLGRALQKTRTNIEDLGFDFVCFDEAHALKNIFSQVKARPKKGMQVVEEEEEKGPRGKKMYEISGSTSTRGIKAYMLCSYIQSRHDGRNVMLLTATPFTNSPLEVYSMLSLIAYTYLRKIGLANINDFFDNYCQMSYELVINSKLQPVRKQVFKAFDNLQSLQKLVYKFMLHKEAGKPDKNGNVIALIRPDKWVLPYRGRFNEKNVYIPASPDEITDTIIPLSSEQKELMEEIIKYVEGGISYGALQARGVARQLSVDDKEAESEEKTEEILLDEDFLDEKEKAGVRTLRGVNFARSLALSPYLYEFSGLGKPDYKNYVDKSPKLKFIMECIRSVKAWHEAKGETVSGQVIYMDRGKDYFELLRDYLVNEIGYKEHEVAIIRSGGKEGSKDHKDNVKNGFNGLKFDDKTKSFSNIPDEDRIKVLIGTSSIREGMNLQRYCTILYNAFVDWNPTDEIQLEGRIWRQGNSFSNVRIVIPMMADSMDIFMFQKLEEKTSRINSIWNYDGQSNVLKIEELDPQELKKGLITNPRVLAEIEVETVETKIEEDIAAAANNIKIAQNILSFFESRDDFEEQLTKVLKILEPGKKYASIELMARDFERLLKEQEEDENVKLAMQAKLRSEVENRYEYAFIDYDYELQRSYRYGTMKASIANIKRAKRSFMDKFKIKDDRAALEAFIDKTEKQQIRMREDIERLRSNEYLDERAREIELERKKQKIKLLSLPERVKEFEKFNYLLEFRSDKALFEAEEFIYTEIEGCPPMKGDTFDNTVEGIKLLEACIAKMPQTKELNIDETGEYTEKRKKVHNKIKAEIRSGLKCRVTHEKPVAILTGGPPAGGKTTFLKGYAPNLTKDKIFRIDADEIRAKLPEYKGWNASVTHKETQDIYRSLLKEIGEGKPCRFDLLWDGTMNKAENYKPLIGDLKHLGYDIYIIYVSVDWKESKAGVIERYGLTGRYIPMAVVEEAIKEGRKSFEDLKALSDGWMYVKGGRTQEIIEKGGKDVLEGRGYFDKKPTDKDVKLKKARAIAIAQKQKIEILKLKAA